MAAPEASKNLTLTFESLNANYPRTEALVGGLCSSYENQCAIRMSQALNQAGLKISSGSYPDPTCKADGILHARGAESLANFLWRKLGPPVVSANVKNDFGFRGSTGIIFFKDITGFRGGLGDHIDLWDGSKTKGFNGFGQCAEVWFWSLPRKYVN